MHINNITYSINRYNYQKSNTTKPFEKQITKRQEVLAYPTYYYIKPSISFKSKNELDTYMNQIKGLKLDDDMQLEYNAKFEPPKETTQGNCLYDKQFKEAKETPQELFHLICVKINNENNTKNYDEILLRLIKDDNLNVNKKYSSGYSIWCNPLFILTTLNRPYLLQEALKKKDANPNIRCGNSNYLSPLMRAVKTNSLDCAYVLLKSGKMDNDEIQRCLNEGGSNNEMRGLLESYPFVDEYLKKINTINTSSLKFKLEDISDVLVNPKLNPNFVDINGNNFFHILSYIDDEKQALELFFNAVKRNININTVNNANKTPIEKYLENKKYSLVCAAIDSGADLSICNDNHKNTFAHKVTSMTEEDVAIKILDYADQADFNIDKQNFVGITPAITATKTKKYKLLKFLIDKGAKINSPDNNGMTPMHYACILNDINLIEILINQCVDFGIRDKFGKLATDYLKNPKIIEFCKKIQASI